MIVKLEVKTRCGVPSVVNLNHLEIACAREHVVVCGLIAIGVGNYLYSVGSDDGINSNSHDFLK